MDEIDRFQEFQQQKLEDHIAAVQRKVANAGAIAQEFCDDCGCEIPMARRVAAPFTTRCVECQEGVEKR